MDYVFDDKRLGVTFLMIWLSIVLYMFYHIGMFEGQYMCMGPSENTVFMHSILNTWEKWSAVAVFTAINTCINDFMSDAISPWLLNTITDHKTKYIQYPKYQCIIISQMWSLYCGIMGVIGMMLSLTQVDFVLIRLMCDLLVNLYTNSKFLKPKVYDSTKYFQLDVKQDQDEIVVYEKNTPATAAVYEIGDNT
jgi:Na+-transporting methylmalonyl-CoA/oxaloacetate decarboxylase gamma subunit